MEQMKAAFSRLNGLAGMVESKGYFMKRTFLLLGLLLALPMLGAAQSYTINWYKIAGGGGISTGGTASGERHDWPAGCERGDDQG